MWPRLPRTSRPGRLRMAPQKRLERPRSFSFPPLYFFVLATTAGASGGEGTTGEAGGEGSEHSNEGADPNRAPEEDDLELGYHQIFLMQVDEFPHFGC